MTHRNLAVVVSQPMFFPWVGMLEQVRLADVYVHYHDVQFSKGSLVNRVRIKGPQGATWLTVPLEHVTLGQAIDEVRISRRVDWRRRHVANLKQAYSGAPFVKSMIRLVESVYDQPHDTIDALSRASLCAVCEYYGLDAGRRFVDVGELDIAGSGSPRVLAIVQALSGVTYITGWGAANYLDHEAFERAGVSVRYMDYQKLAYPQLYGAFNPFVSALDLIANAGESGIEVIRSGTVDWRDFIHHE